MIEEKELIKGCVAGKSKYQKILYQRYQGIVMGIGSRYAKNREDAEDIVQDAFIKIFLNLKHYRHEGSFDGWIKRVTTNTALDYLKSRKKWEIVDSIDEHHRDIQDTIIVEGDDIPVEKLKEFISQLPDGYRTVFNLCAIDEYKQEEIAVMLGCSHSNVRTQYFKAKKVLQGMIEEWRRGI
ncbi:MAG: sigma-70 family RNA polymerase sigma factor [Bacteroidales bacterium]